MECVESRATTSYVPKASPCRSLCAGDGSTQVAFVCTDGMVCSKKTAHCQCAKMIEVG